MTITWIDERTGYLPGQTTIGVVRLGGDRALLVDAGLDADRARTIVRALEAEGLRAAALLITHAHADHFGGAPALRKRGTELIAASPMTAVYLRHPELESVSLSGWAAPPRELLTKFFLGPTLEVDVEVGPGPWTLPGDPGMVLLALPGHAMGQLGLQVGDVVFCGDAVFSPQVWQRHPFVYMADIAASLKSLDLLDSLAPRALAGGHIACRVGEDLDPAALVRTTREGILGLSRTILETVESAGSGGASLDGLLADLAAQLDTGFAAVGDYYLARAALQAHLTHLAQEGLVRPVPRGGELLWTTAAQHGGHE